jgi:class 3 adenylate cyclase/tetratricopeptide (TPR) repeat protein
VSHECQACGAQNRPEARFCSQCGMPLATSCAACGAALDPHDRFCATCGTAVGDTPAATVATPPRETAERRLVSVLFADLVGYTSLSEGRDPEEVRRLLEGYFRRCRETIARYGGTVEKFIGDAVMAVWGTPVAREDDAERAVRAGLALAAAIPEIGAAAGLEDLRLRVGILTGQAAVDVGAEGEGMVIGDAVNTASRIQSVAPPGGVLVDDATRRATAAAIVYEEGGSFELKGKSEAVHTWRAVRVVAGMGGRARAAALEAPFVGRDDELAALRGDFEAVLDGGAARLVSVIGEAGIGKSRLAWELQKHADGLSAEVLWHRGRCLPYGEGVAFWALAEMVRARAGVSEDDDQPAALGKLEAAVTRYVADPRERRLIEPRLAQLLGFGDRGPADRAGLFSAWRAWLEALARARPLVLVFEDIQWADQGLLDFIEHVLEWSGELPILILTLARPELGERRAGWGEAARSLALGPLPDAAMAELLGGLVPGLEAELRDRLAARAEGIPLYAVEIVRMLLDRGVLERRGDAYVVIGDVDEVAVPETLHALVASRLDALAPAERRALQDGAVVGLTFTLQALAEVAGLAESEARELLDGLVRKQLLALDEDPLSPERGQYAFLQALVRRVAYETLSRSDRRARHLATAQHLEGIAGAGVGDIAEVLADHYVQAVRSEPDAPDAGELADKACGTLAAAGDRAAGLAAHAEAARYYEQAAELARDDLARAGPLEQAGRSLWRSARAEQAVEVLARAVELFDVAGEPRSAARCRSWIGEVHLFQGRMPEAVDQYERALAVLSEGGPCAELAFAQLGVGGIWILEGDIDRGEPHVDAALEIAERFLLMGTLAEALVIKGVAHLYRRRRETGIALWKRAIELGAEHDAGWPILWALNNLSATYEEQGRFEEALEYSERGLELARQRGERNQELPLLANKLELLGELGRWGEALAIAGDLADGGELDWVADRLPALLRLHVWRGEDAAAERVFATIEAREHTRVMGEAIRDLARAFMARHRGDPATALEAAERALPHQEELTVYALAMIEALEAVWALGDHDRLQGLIDSLGGRAPVERSPLAEAEAARFEAKLALAVDDRARAQRRFRRAAGLHAELGTPFRRAVVLLEHAELLSADGRPEEAAPLAVEAREIFERLGAAPYIGRVDALGLPNPTPA